MGRRGKHGPEAYAEIDKNLLQNFAKCDIIKEKEEIKKENTDTSKISPKSNTDNNKDLTVVKCEECGKEILKKNAQVFSGKALCDECAKKQNEKGNFSTKLKNILDNCGINKYDIPKIVRQITTLTKMDEYDEDIVEEEVSDLFNPENPKVTYNPQLNIYNVLEKNYYIYYNRKKELAAQDAYWAELKKDHPEIIEKAVSPEYDTVYISQEIINRDIARKNKKMYDQRFGSEEDIETYLKMRREEEEEFK